MYEYRCKLERIIDGDTVDVTVDLGFKVYHKMRIRLAGIDTPERGQAGYQEAIDYVKEWFDMALNEALVSTQKDKADSFGRYLGTFYEDGPWRTSLNEHLVQNELAKEYTR